MTLHSMTDRGTAYVPAFFMTSSLSMNNGVLDISNMTSSKVLSLIWFLPSIRFSYKSASDLLLLDRLFRDSFAFPAADFVPLALDCAGDPPVTLSDCEGCLLMSMDSSKSSGSSSIRDMLDPHSLDAVTIA
jgi:hypothetical protein